MTAPDTPTPPAGEIVLSRDEVIQWAISQAAYWRSRAKWGDTSQERENWRLDAARIEALAALAASPATLEARVRGLEAEWRARSAELEAYASERLLSGARGTAVKTECQVLASCADALAALLKGGENG